MIIWMEDQADGWRRAALPTPVGPLTVVYTETAVVASSFTDPGPYWFGRPVPPGVCPPWLEDLVALALHESLAGTDWRLLNPGLSATEAGALDRATAIPFGETRAYGELARAIDLPGRARLVGRAMSRSPASLLIPTHRVIRADGRPAPSERGGTADRLRAYERALVRTATLAAPP